MTQKLSSEPIVQSNRRWLICCQFLLFLVSLIVALAIRLHQTDLYFLITPYPPVPPSAMNVLHGDGGSLGGYRTVEFETDQPAEKIQQFYRTELPNLGWKLFCTPTQLEQSGCSLGLSSVQELADAFKRYDDPSNMREINISIFKPGENLVNSQNRLVEVVEYHYPLPIP